MAEKSLGEFFDKNPTAELSGFFWCEKDSYHVVILASVGRSCAAREFSGATAEALVAEADAAGWHIGTTAQVHDWCSTAPRSPRPRRLKAASPDAK